MSLASIVDKILETEINQADATKEEIDIPESSQNADDSGSGQPEVEEIYVYEKIHVVIHSKIRSTELTKSTPSNDDDCAAVNAFLTGRDNSESTLPSHNYPLLSGDELINYMDYDFPDFKAEMFLPCVFPGLSTRRYFDEERRNIMSVIIDSKGNTAEYLVQEDNTEKYQLQKRHTLVAQKLAYMIYDGEEAIANYKNDRVPMNGGGHRITDNYIQMIRISNYGLWGKYYTQALGWHRGIDMTKGGGASILIHAICRGEVIQRTSSYISIYNHAANVTFTYMHLEYTGDVPQGKATDQGWVKAYVSRNEVLGYEWDNKAGGKKHTHIEVNPGRYYDDNWTGLGVGRPMSGDLSMPREVDGTTETKIPRDIALDMISPGNNFSLNPYPFIERVWNFRVYEHENSHMWSDMDYMRYYRTGGY